jgi:uncharacterized protein YegP (UPF0339 family)
MLRIEIYQDASGGWRWRGVDGNYRIICDGAEGYVTRDGVEKGLDNVMNEFRGDVQVVTKNRRRAAVADAKAETILQNRRGEGGWATWDEVASYQAEGAKAK